MRRALVLALISAAVLSCTLGEIAAPTAEDPDSAAGPGAGDGAATTFHEHVEPILRKVCQDCHVPGGIAPFPLVTYEEAKLVGEAMVAETRSRRMPPWGAQSTDECQPPHPWKDDLRLSEQEIATIEAWHAGGDLRGDPAKAPPPRAPKAAGLSGAISLAPSPFTLTGDKDELVCFVLDPQLTTTRFLNGTFFVPKNETIVHHALAFAIAPGATVPGEQPGEPPAPYECFGGPRVPGDQFSLVAAWAPGSVPVEYPPNVGREVPPGTRFVMQVHYHPHRNARPEPDATELQIRLTDTPPEWNVVTQLIGNFRKAPAAGEIGGLLPGPNDPPSGAAFEIPPGAVGHVETMTVTVPAFLPEVRIAGVGAHMHLAGRDEKITLRRPGADTQCLLQEPAWDFDWQRGYAYDAPIESLPVLRGGDSIDIRCTYDNTMKNDKLASALREQGFSSPQPIALGEATTEEMCLGAFVFFHQR